MIWIHGSVEGFSLGNESSVDRLAVEGLWNSRHEGSKTRFGEGRAHRAECRAVASLLQLDWERASERTCAFCALRPAPWTPSWREMGIYIK